MVRWAKVETGFGRRSPNAKPLWRSPAPRLRRHAWAPRTPATRIHLALRVQSLKSQSVHSAESSGARPLREATTYVTHAHVCARSQVTRVSLANDQLCEKSGVMVLSLPRYQYSPKRFPTWPFSRHSNPWASPLAQCPAPEASRAPSPLRKADQDVHFSATSLCPPLISSLVTTSTRKG